LITDSSDICAQNQTKVGRTNIINHEIYTGNARPVRQPPYRTDPIKEKFLIEEIFQMEEQETYCYYADSTGWESPASDYETYIEYDKNLEEERWSDGYDNSYSLQESWPGSPDQQINDEDDYTPFNEFWSEARTQQEQEIKELFSITVKPEYSFPELLKWSFRDLLEENIVTKHVVANQPIRKGGSKCTWECDEENHHQHNYCKLCKRNLPYGVKWHQNCKYGFERDVRPPFNPDYLFKFIYWKEPEAVVRENEECRRFAQQQRQQERQQRRQQQQEVDR
jgi:hypothetical protein